MFGSICSAVTFIPQGSILTLIHYILCTADLSGILTLMGWVSTYQYVDDTQAFAHDPAIVAASLVTRVFEATVVLNPWMSSFFILILIKPNSSCLAAEPN